MLLVTNEGKTASIWNVPSGTTWTTTPHVTFKGHRNHVLSGAFVGDESHVITGSSDSSIRIWRTSEGVQTANVTCNEEVCHALSIYIAHHLLCSCVHCRITLHLATLLLVSSMVELNCCKLLPILQLKLFFPPTCASAIG